MAYTIKIEAIIKLFKDLTTDEISHLINEALWDIEEFRDVLLIHFEWDGPETPNNPFKKSFSDINLQEIVTQLTSEECQSCPSEQAASQQSRPSSDQTAV